MDKVEMFTIYAATTAIENAVLQYIGGERVEMIVILVGSDGRTAFMLALPTSTGWICKGVHDHGTA